MPGRNPDGELTSCTYQVEGGNLPPLCGRPGFFRAVVIRNIFRDEERGRRRFVGAPLRPCRAIFCLLRSWSKEIGYCTLFWTCQRNIRKTKGGIAEGSNCILEMAVWAFRFRGGGETARSASEAGRFVPEGDAEAGFVGTISYLAKE